MKRPRSRAHLKEDITSDLLKKGKVPPKLEPGRPIRGELDLEGILENINEQFKTNEKVIVDTSKLDSSDLASLRRALAEKGLLGTKVLLHPEPAAHP